MRNKRFVEKASVLNTASAKNGKPFVLAAAKPALRQVALSSFACAACTFEFAAVKGSEPFCVCCGSDKTKPVKAVAAKLPATDAELSAISCQSCDTHNVLHNVTAGLLQGRMHCVTCSTALEFIEKAEADSDLADPITDAPAADIENVLDTVEVSDTISPEDRGGITDDAPITDAPAADINAQLPVTQESTADNLTDPLALQAPAADQTADADTLPMVDPAPVDQTAQQDQQQPMVESLDDDEMIEHADTQDDQDAEGQDEQDACESFVQASLLAVVLASDRKPELSLTIHDHEILAFANGVPVARLEKSAAGEHAGVFHSKSFAQAIVQTAAAKGLAKALKEFAFAPITVQFPQRAAVKATVERRVAVQATALAARSKELSADLEHSLRIAASALTKNYFKKHGNALRDGFVNTLATAGIQNAKQMVNQVFAAHADAYHRTLLTLATEINARSLESRNELAETLGEMNMPMDDAMIDTVNPPTDDVAVEHADLGSRMENASVRPARTQVAATTATTASNSASIHDLRQRAGGKLF